MIRTLTMAAKDSLGDQFIDIYHASDSANPPHNSPRGRPPIFAGTRDAALDRAAESDRTHIHKYRIPKKMIRPELWADDHFDTDGPQQIVHSFAGPRGATLWEGEPVRSTGLKQGDILQYRNHVEDIGSISYIFHKHDVGKRGKIKYLGSEELDVI